MPILSPAQPSLELTDAPLAGVLPAGGETERPISIPRPTFVPCVSEERWFSTQAVYARRLQA